MPSKYPDELRERAVRMVLEHQGDHGSQWAAIGSNAGKVGCTPESLRRWVRQAQVDAGDHHGVSSSESERVRALQREVRDLREANAILKDAAVFFAGALDLRRH